MKRKIAALAVLIALCTGCQVNVVVAPHAVLEAGSRNIESVSHDPNSK